MTLVGIEELRSIVREEVRKAMPEAFIAFFPT